MWTALCFVCVTGDDTSSVIPTDAEDQHKEAEWNQWLEDTDQLPFSILDALVGSKIPTSFNDSTPVTKIGLIFIIQILHVWII